MSSEKLGGNYRATESEKPAWRVERERDLARKRKLGEAAIGAVAAVLIATALSHSAKTSEIMNNEERAKNVKKIEVEGIVFHDGVNARKDPVIDKAEPNQLASVGEEGESVTIDYEGEAYYYKNENDANGGWYGFVADQLSDELLKGGYITQIEADRLESDKDSIAWLNENYVGIVETDETNYTMMVEPEENS